jgi:DNA ligase-1
MRRFGRKLDVARMREEIPLTTCFFDCLYRDGEDWIDRATEDRFRALSDSVPSGLLVPRRVTGDSSEAEAFAKEAIDAGHEGLMAKALDAPYQAGGRGQSWLKVKPAHTLDLVVLAAEWGHGRRRGWLSNLHLGARDPSSGQFVMLGKTFKGMTDEMLQWQTERLQEIEISRDRWAVYVRPELVVEVAFNEIQASPQYPGGLALRFARVKGCRPDKSPEEADTMESVRAIYRARVGGVSEE